MSDHWAELHRQQAIVRLRHAARIWGGAALIAAAASALTIAVLHDAPARTAATVMQGGLSCGSC